MESCPDATPTLFGLFDTSIAPPLFFFAYIPALLYLIFLSTRALFVGKGSRASWLFAGFSFAYALWIIADVFSWTAAPVSIVTWSWAAFDPLSVLVGLFAVLFIHEIVFAKAASRALRMALIALVTPAVILAPTHFAITGFDLANCNATVGHIYHNYVIAVQVIFLLLLSGVLYSVVFKKRELALSRKTCLTLSIFSLAFLVTFYVTSFVGGYLQDFKFETIASGFAVLFVGILSYFSSEGNKFSVQMFGAQSLVVMLGFIVSSLVFVRDISNVRYAALIAFAFVISVGFVLVRSTRRELEQREQIEGLAGRLKSVNRIMSHDVKSVLNKNKMLMEALLDGSFGEVPSAAKNLISKAEHETGNMLEAVMTILQSGQELVLHKESYDIKKDVLDVIETLTPDARMKGLSLHVDLDYGQSVVLSADPLFMRVHVIKNLILNSILYTPSGSIVVRLEHEPGEKVLFSVKDTGVGIAPEDAPMLFREGGHGAHSQEINVHSTGYGLFSAKRIVDAHGGKIWFESEGAGKGTTFFVELPIK